MLRNIILISLLSFIVKPNCLDAQVFENLYGTWKVTKEISFTRIGYETEEEYNERMQKHEECLKAEFVIDTSGISVQKNACGFLGCASKFLQSCFRVLSVVTDNDYTLEAMGNEMIDSNIVGRKFVNLLSDNFHAKNLNIYDTRCSVDYGSSTLKICVIDNNNIGLFQDYNLILLKRKNARELR